MMNGLFWMPRIYTEKVEIVLYVCVNFYINPIWKLRKFMIKSELIFSRFEVIVCFLKLSCFPEYLGRNMGKCIQYTSLSKWHVGDAQQMLFHVGIK